MIDVYFKMPKDSNGNFIYKECVGGVAILDVHPKVNAWTWVAYRVYPITKNTVLFQYKDEREFVVQNGHYDHPIGGHIEIQYFGDFMNITITEKKGTS